MTKIQIRIAALIICAIAAGCKQNRVIVTGNVTGLNNATFLLTDETTETIAGDNIVNGHFKVDAVLEHPGFGELQISKNGDNDKARFEIYLENGSYTIDADPKFPHRYPKITSTSAIQNEISAYQEIRGSVVEKADLLVNQVAQQIRAANPSNTTLAQYRVLSERLIQAEHAQTLTQLKTYKEFTERYPNSRISVRLLSQLPYEEDPVGYNAIFQLLSKESRESEAGKQIGEKLSRLIKLVPGADAPTISGTTVDGKPFDKNKLTKKLYVIDFWRAGNQMGRVNHQDMVNDLIKNRHYGEFEIISVSLDTKRNWWTTAIKDDHMTWLQYSDLKGDSSPNTEAWMISRIPSYYVVDGQWRIVAHDPNFSSLDDVIEEFFKNYKEPSRGKNFSL